MLFSIQQEKRGNSRGWKNHFDTDINTVYLSPSTKVTPHIVMGLSCKMITKWRDNCIFLKGFKISTSNGIKVVEYSDYILGTNVFKSINNYVTTDVHICISRIKKQFVAIVTEKSDDVRDTFTTLEVIPKKQIHTSVIDNCM